MINLFIGITQCHQMNGMKMILPAESQDKTSRSNGNITSNVIETLIMIQSERIRHCCDEYNVWLLLHIDHGLIYRHTRTNDIFKDTGIIINKQMIGNRFIIRKISMIMIGV